MEQDFTIHCDAMDRDFDVEVYGEGGAPVIVFPEGNGSCSSWNNHGMVETLSELLDEQRVQLFCVDSADALSWYFSEGEEDYRLTAQRQYLGWVYDRFVPFVREHNDGIPIVAGAGIGALNATVALLQRPDLFGGLLAMSGTYDVREVVGEVFDDEWLAFSPVDLVRGLTDQQLQTLAPRLLAFVCGQNDSETGLASQHALDVAFAERRIQATFEYWGYDVSHDWIWWQEEARQLLPCLLTADGLEERKRTGVLSRAKIAASHAADVLDARRADLEGAQAWLQNASANVESTSHRLQAEEANVENRSARSEELKAKAAQLWAARDKAAAALESAEAMARSAQDDADAAAHTLADAEWIAGEARAAAKSAADDEAAARASVEERQEAVRKAEHASERASAALKAAEE